MPGPKRTPRHLRLLRGTLRPSRDQTPAVGLPPITDAPRPPRWLTNVAGLREWNRLARIMLANGLLTEGNIILLSHTVMLGLRIAEGRRAGATPDASLLAVYRRLLGDLGLSSMAALPAPQDKPNRFASH